MQTNSTSSFNQSVGLSHLFVQLFRRHVFQFLSFHLICLSCHLLLFSSCAPEITCLSALSTNNCLLSCSLLVLLSEYTMLRIQFHCSHRSRDEEKIIQLENYFPFFPVRFLPSTLSRDTLIRYVFACP